MKKILGIDLGSNSLGWALIHESDGKANEIVDMGVRIFNKAVEEKIPTPKNVKRRNMRLARRVTHRRARRKQKMLNYLISLKLLPSELIGHTAPEVILNTLGDPYFLRTKALDQPLEPHELGRILLSFASRRGFLSNRKQAAGDLIDDPDTLDLLNELDTQDSKTNAKSEETAFKQDIKQLQAQIAQSGARTLGEYLYKRKQGDGKRNRQHLGGHLRTDRSMYQHELQAIWAVQAPHFTHLPEDFMTDKRGVQKIIFYQRPLKLKKDRVGKCSLEPKHTRARQARLEVQRFRYTQDLVNMTYFDRHLEQSFPLTDEQRQTLIEYCEHHEKITPTAIKKLLKLEEKPTLNLEEKNIKGNTTACAIRAILPETWDEMEPDQQTALVEDLLTIKKKSALKTRLETHWGIDTITSVKLCLLELEPGHANLSLRAIKKLLPHMTKGERYDQARVTVGYGYEVTEIQTHDKLPAPPLTANPIVNKGLHELRRVINALILEHGKPDTIRIEMARDLEMNTKRYREFITRQKKNESKREEAKQAIQNTGGNKYPSRDDVLKYRLWQDQGMKCAYSCLSIPLNQLFTNATEVDHILPYKKSLDNSYMNKVVCFTAENRQKSDRTPKDAWGQSAEKWNQMTQALSKWDKDLHAKKQRFFKTEADLLKRDFISTQLNDTRYIARLSQTYLAELGCDISVTKGGVVAEIRRFWGFNTLLGDSPNKERTDHRHHAIDAVVIAATSRSLYQAAVNQIHNNRLSIPIPYPRMRTDMAYYLEEILVSHSPQRKITGALHEDTGANYIAKHGGTVYRKTLDSNFTEKNVKNILDPTIKEIVMDHLKGYPSIKAAFADGITLYHRDGKTPIHRVRVLQSATTEKRVVASKFAVKDKSGKIFKYMTYGNAHHVEILRHQESNAIKAIFINTMEASRRARGIGCEKQPMVQTDHGDGYILLMALHINDTVSVLAEDETRIFYRIQTIDALNKKVVLRRLTAATLSDKTEAVEFGISEKNFQKYDLRLHRTNAIGKLLE